MRLIPMLSSLLFARAFDRSNFLRESGPDVVQDRYIVVLKPGMNDVQIQRHYKSIEPIIARRSDVFQGVVSKYQLGGDFSGYSIECDEHVLEDINKLSSVAYIARDRIVTGQSSNHVPQDLDNRSDFSKVRRPDFQTLSARSYGHPRDVMQSNNWGLGRLSHRSPGARDYVYQKLPKTKAYVLDTGIRISHREFAGRAVWGANFVPGAPNTDDNGHGTHIAGIIAGETVGVDSTTIPIAVKVLDANSTGMWSRIMDGVNWVVQDARQSNALSRSVISISIGGSGYKPLDDALQAAISSGLTVIAASSNFGANACQYSPARIPSVITVSAIDKTDARPSWSNFGSCVDVFAPGTEVYSAWKDGDVSYSIQSGTSMATPFVSGLVTYLMSREGVTGPANLAERIRSLGTKGKVRDAGVESPNLIAFNGNTANLRQHSRGRQ